MTDQRSGEIKARLENAEAEAPDPNSIARLHELQQHAPADIAWLLDEVARLKTERNEWREKYVRSPDHSEEQFQREEITRLEAENAKFKAEVDAAYDVVNGKAELNSLRIFQALKASRDKLEAELREAKAHLKAREFWDKVPDAEALWKDMREIGEQRDKLAEELRIARDSMQLVYVNQDADTLRELVVTQEKLAHARVANHQAWERIRTSEIERDAARAEVKDYRDALVTIECGVVTTIETAQYAGFKPKEIARAALARHGEG
jgi:hypothetical protein